MITTKQQFALLYPSIPDALFRRLMMDETLAFLRKDNTIYGFRLTINDNPLPGLVQIAVSKQHILAYVTPKEVILFPSVDVLGDSAYQFDTITVEKVRVLDDTFRFESVGRGTVSELSAEYLPPFKALDVSEETLEKMMVALTSSAEAVAATTLRRRRNFHINFTFGKFQDIADEVLNMGDPVTVDEGFSLSDESSSDDETLDYGDDDNYPTDYPEDMSEYDEMQGEHPEDFSEGYPEDFSEEYPEDFSEDADGFGEQGEAVKDDEPEKPVPKEPTVDIAVVRKERARKLLEQWELEMFHNANDVERYAILHLGVPSNTYNLLLNVLVQASGTFKSESMLVEGIVKLLARAIEAGKAE